MKKKFNFLFFFALQVILINCNFANRNLKNEQEIELKNKAENDKTTDILKNDSITHLYTMSYEQLFIDSENRFKAIGDLKFNPSTEKARYSYIVNGDSISITLYHLKSRIIVIEKRIYVDNQEDSFVILDFSENNELLSESSWKRSEKKTFTNAIYWNKLIKFNSDCKAFKLDEKQKKEIIKSTKALLDSVMQFFPDFRYTFNWETYLTVN